MKKWKLEINTDEKIHRHIIREVESPPFVGPQIAEVNPYNIAKREQHGRLIAAAPELLEALKKLVYRCDGSEGVQPDGSNMCTLEAHAAIRKAEGNE